MRYTTLEALIGAADEQVAEYLPGSALAATWEAIAQEVRRELESMQRTSIVDDPITISPKDLDDIGWNTVTILYAGESWLEYRCPFDDGIRVSFHLDGPDIVVWPDGNSEGRRECHGVKTVDDLLDLVFRLTGRRQSR